MQTTTNGASGATNLPPSERTVVQIAVSQAAGTDTGGDYPQLVFEREVVALCDDGTVWSYGATHNHGGWQRLPGVPGTAQGIADAAAKVEREAARKAEYERAHAPGMPLPVDDCDCARCDAAYGARKLGAVEVTA